jgi:hypothetical protein
MWGADLFAKTAREFSSWSKDISSNIKVGEIQENGAQTSVTVGVSLLDVPQAAAFEFGSGIHGPSGMKYPIFGPLAFPGTHDWAGQTIFVPPMGGGVVLHPGVAARPYMRPAAGLVRLELKRSFGDAVRISVKGVIREAWSGK